jgi:hypothetical protein
MPVRVEDIDLAALAEALQRTFEGHVPTGYLPGRTVFRDAVVEELECSQLEAEQLIDTMIGRGFLRYQGDPAEQVDDLTQPWMITPRL